MQGSKPDIEKLLAEAADAAAMAMAECVPHVAHEEEVRITLTKVLDAFVEAAGLSIKAKHEHALAGGRIDSKYGAVILEYKTRMGPRGLEVAYQLPAQRLLLSRSRVGLMTFTNTRDWLEIGFSGWAPMVRRLYL